MTEFATRLTGYVSTLRGWRGKLALFIAGAATAAGFAPFYIAPIALITIPFLFLMLDKARHPRSAALYGWAFGYGYMMAGTYWVANALTVDMQQFGWLIPISILGLSLVMGIWWALFGALYRWLRTARTDLNLLRFAVLWVVGEYIRSVGIFGFPWNLMGSMALASERLAQPIALVGTYGMSFLILLLALIPVLYLRRDPRRQHALIVALVVIILTYSYGMWRMPDEAAMTGTRVRVVQGNIAQSLKWTQQGRIDSAHIYGALSRMQSDTEKPYILVWPETALPFTLREHSEWPAQLSELLQPGGLLITGAVRSEGEVEGYKLYNSIIAIDANGVWRDSYDKHQLVPFGEFVPLRSVLPIDKITPGGIDFSRGEGARNVSIDAIPPYRPLVCYEVIFPWLSAGKDRPAWIVNATNDAWYGMSPGPFQHFDTARLRALEQGVPVVRAANTGISAVIDPYGRAVRRLGLNERGIIDQALPEILSPTPYSKFGECITLTILLGVWLVTVLSLFRAKK